MLTDLLTWKARKTSMPYIDHLGSAKYDEKSSQGKQLLEFATKSGKIANSCSLKRIGLFLFQTYITCRSSS